MAACGLAAMLGPVTMLAHADPIYRCRSGDVLVYSDKPCARGAKPADLPDAIVVPAGPKLDLLEQADAKREQERRDRDAADAQWNAQHQARKAEAERIREGRIKGVVVEGMTEMQVRHLHGEPAVTSSSRRAGKARETWSYVLDDGSRLHVTFEDGRVVSTRSKREKR